MTIAARSETRRVRLPLMEAFRAAHSARDARSHIDIHNEAGERVLSGRRSGARSVMSSAELQRCVAHDLERLMNAVNFAADTDLSLFPEVGHSILNHGFVDIARLSLEDSRVSDIAGEIEAALRRFEPRLASRSLAVWHDTDVDPSELKLRFVVRAEIEADPLNIPVEFLADLECDSGRVRVARR